MNVPKMGLRVMVMPGIAIVVSAIVETLSLSMTLSSCDTLSATDHRKKSTTYNGRAEDNERNAKTIDTPFLGLPPDADENGNYAFFDAANYALIQMTGGVTATPVV